VVVDNISDHLRGLTERLNELEQELADPAVVRNVSRYKQLGREHTRVQRLVGEIRRLVELERRVEEALSLVSDDDEELAALARDEISELQPQLEQLRGAVLGDLLPPDPHHDKNAILEIRAGTGGEEAALFASDLFRMYARFAERQNWKIERLSTSPTELGGVREVICAVHGSGAYGRLRYESGVHRVQRVPTTEASGRIHTSAVSVAVLPEAEEIDLDLDPKDLRIDVYRSSGPGGQSVNTTDSAVRITHEPTGITVQCQDEKSQHKNKSKALKVLRARLLDRAIREREEEMAKQRRDQVGTGDRSAKIRTYNFPQSRVTDHRIALTLYRLDEVLDGDLETIVSALEAHNAEQQMADLERKANDP
jgi:peptide chain release factor 1